MDVEQQELIKDLAGKLEAAGIRYMLSGSSALSYYAQPRMTRDIDIVVELREEDAAKVVKLLGGDYHFDEDTLRDAIAHRSMFNAIHEATVHKIDFIVRKDEPYRIEELARRRRHRIAGIDVWIVSPEDLVLSKLVWAKDSSSELQLRDVRNLLLAQTELDQEYLQRWAATLGVVELLQRVSP